MQSVHGFRTLNYWHSVWKRFKTICISEVIQQDKSNVIASELERAWQSRGGFCGLLRHSIPRKDNRVVAFTLAEVLITLVIIGVIAALTIPNLMQKYTEQATVKKVQKFYSNISNAYKLAMKDNGTFDEWGLKGNYNAASNRKVYEMLFKPYFKVAKNCGNDTSVTCIAKTYITLNNTVAGDYGISNAFYKLTLDDGSAIFQYMLGSTDSPIVRIAYDTNGTKEPNQFGKDTFMFDLSSNGIVPYGLEESYRTNFRYTCRVDGQTCAAWVIYKGNMDYLHCKDLSWTGKNKCSK